MPTHEVLNQSVPLPPFDAFRSDVALSEAIERGEGGWCGDRLSALGSIVGSPEIEELAREANRNPPELKAHDRFGHRIDEVTFHPSYHRLMALGKTHGVHSASWLRGGSPGAFVGRSGLHYLFVQAEYGVCCPLTMTHAVIPSLRKSPSVAATWEPRVLENAYDPRLVSADQKTGVTFGMAMTEKQGGSDVRTNTTVARPAPEGGVRLVGHKWFCSAPMSDAFLTLAQGPDGLTCYLVPRVLPDGTRNPLHIQRLKDKLGNRSNASSEIEYHETWAEPVGDPGRGVATIIEMVAQTRLDVATGSAAAMRQAVRYAIHHATHRSAFGATLIQQPLMRNVLADLALETEAAVALSFRIAAAFDRGRTDPGEAAFARVGTAIAKYWLAKRVIGLTAEALECHGGNGYAEDWPMARLYREAPLGSIWEGSGNVQCLDVLRAIHKSPASLAALWAELERPRGMDRRLDALLDSIKAELGDRETLQHRARRITERVALALQAGLLLRHAPSALAEAFLAGRLADGGLMYGNLPVGVDLDAILERTAAPA